MDDLLEALAQGRITVDEARRRLAAEGLHAVEDLAVLDLERDARTGVPEVVLAEGKSPTALARIVAAALDKRGEVLVSRLEPRMLEESGLRGLDGPKLDYDAEARFARIHMDRPGPTETIGRVALLTAGTADRAVAMEACLTLQALGVAHRLWCDRGVAAPARLAPALREILDWDPDVLIVAAGREGTLATLVASLVPVPVVGLPVSTGYGKGGQGEAALLAMLQSCSSLSVVNIDAGVTAGLVAARIAKNGRRDKPRIGLEPEPLGQQS